MTIEEAKEELKRYKFDQARIDEAIEDIEALKERAFKITSTLSDMPRGTSPIQDKKAEIVAKYVDKANEMAILNSEMMEKQKKIESKILKIQQPYQNILYFTYQKGMNLTQVASKIGYEYIYTTELHGKALKLYAELE